MDLPSVFVFAVLAGLVALSEWLVRRTALKHIGSALLVIVLTAIVANVGIIPTTSTPEAPVPAYDIIFSIVAPVSIFWLLLHVNLRAVMRAGLPILSVFGIGAVATVIGVFAGMFVINGAAAFGSDFGALGGMFAGTYTGGSVNFNAVALHYEVMQQGVLYGGAVVVDNIVTTIWIAVTLVVPRILAGVRRRVSGDIAEVRDAILGIEDDTEELHPLDVGVTLFIGFGALALSEWLSRLAEPVATIPSILIITTLALIVAQLPVAARIRGARSLGMFAVYLFLAVIGAYCDFGALGNIGTLGANLLAFASVVVVVHGVLTYGAAAVLRIDPTIASVASQANVGGSTSALALARSLGRDDLVLPAVLIGSLGNAAGTYLGFWTAAMLPIWLA